MSLKVQQTIDIFFTNIQNETFFVTLKDFEVPWKKVNDPIQFKV